MITLNVIYLNFLKPIYFIIFMQFKLLACWFYKINFILSSSERKSRTLATFCCEFLFIKKFQWWYSTNFVLLYLLYARWSQIIFCRISIKKICPYVKVNLLSKKKLKHIIRFRPCFKIQNLCHNKLYKILQSNKSTGNILFYSFSNLKLFL